MAWPTINGHEREKERTRRMHHTQRMVKVAGTQWCAQYPPRSPNVLYIGVSICSAVRHYDVDRNIGVDGAVSPTERFPYPETKCDVCSRYTDCSSNSTGQKSRRLGRSDVRFFSSKPAARYLPASGHYVSVRRLCKCSRCY